MKIIFISIVIALIALYFITPKITITIVVLLIAILVYLFNKADNNEDMDFDGQSQ